MSELENKIEAIKLLSYLASRGAIEPEWDSNDSRISEWILEQLYTYWAMAEK